MQPPWWDGQGGKVQTEKHAAVKTDKENSTKPMPKLKTAMDDKTEQFEKIALHAKEANCKCFCEELSADATLSTLDIQVFRKREMIW